MSGLIYFLFYTDFNPKSGYEKFIPPLKEKDFELLLINEKLLFTCAVGSFAGGKTGVGSCTIGYGYFAIARTFSISTLNFLAFIEFSAGLNCSLLLSALKLLAFLYLILSKVLTKDCKWVLRDFSSSSFSKSSSDYD